MKKKFIKRAIPAEISDKGGAYVQFVEKDTVPLDGVIVDTIDGSYCQGRPTLILAAIQGLLKSMAGLPALLRCNENNFLRVVEDPETNCSLTTEIANG